MKTVFIFVEGKADQKFFKDYFNFLSSKDIRFKDVFKIIEIGGKDNLKNRIATIKENMEQHIPTLLIFDADSVENEGGFEKRCSEIEDFRKEKELNFEYFLLPNHKDDGDLENLLEKITNSDNNEIFSCWGKYEKCLENIEIKGKKLKLPARKTKMYAYLEVLNGNPSYEKRDYTDSEHWNLENEFLKPLKKFFEKFV